MARETMTREEFDQRLRASTEQMRQKRLSLEAQVSELEDLIGRYASALERLEAESEPVADASHERREALRHVLTELAAHTSAVASTL